VIDLGGSSTLPWDQLVNVSGTTLVGTTPYGSLLDDAVWTTDGNEFLVEFNPPSGDQSTYLILPGDVNQQGPFVLQMDVKLDTAGDRAAVGLALGETLSTSYVQVFHAGTDYHVFVGAESGPHDTLTGEAGNWATVKISFAQVYAVWQGADPTSFVYDNVTLWAHSIARTVNEIHFRNIKMWTPNLGIGELA
jgi:hypothetical protein